MKFLALYDLFRSLWKCEGGGGGFVVVVVVHLKVVVLVVGRMGSLGGKMVVFIFALFFWMRFCEKLKENEACLVFDDKMLWRMCGHWMLIL